MAHIIAIKQLEISGVFKETIYLPNSEAHHYDAIHIQYSTSKHAHKIQNTKLLNSYFVLTITSHQHKSNSLIHKMPKHLTKKRNSTL